MSADPQGFDPTQPKPEPEKQYMVYRKVVTLRFALDGTVDSTVKEEGWVEVDEATVRKFHNLRPPN